MLQFKVVCFKEDIGIFTGYGAKIRTSSPTPVPPGPHPPHHHHDCIPCDPRFTNKVMYEVVVYTNPELTQSISIYEDKNINICRLVLNNFIKMCLNGMNIINLNKINDRCPIHLHENYHEHFEERPFPLDNVWDKNWEDPRKNPYYSIFEDKEHFPEGFKPSQPPVLVDRDFDRIPVPDGDCTSFKPDFDHHHDHFDPHHHHGDHEFRKMEKTVTHVIPHQLDRIIHEVTPPELRPENKHKIVFYFGNGGFCMGESVTDSIVEISEHALKDMLEKNHQPTFSNMNPRDTIFVKRYIRDSIYPHDVFDTHMDIAGEWCFIMLPDKFYKLIKDFNWYYQDPATDNTWREAPIEMSQTTFTIQDNGIRYFVNAIKFNGDYNVRFAKSGRLMDIPEQDHTHGDTEINRPVDGTMKYRVTLNFENNESPTHYITVKDVTDPTSSIPAVRIKFNAMNNATMDAEPNKVYEIRKTIVEDGEAIEDVPVKYFEVIENFNYKKGFSVWIADENTEEEFIDTKSDVILGVITED